LERLRGDYRMGTRMTKAGARQAPSAPEGVGEQGLRRRQGLLVLLAVNSGATDAIGFVALGGAFTSVMTGNMILLGIAAPTRDSSLAIRSALAIVLFMAGSFVGARIARTPQTADPVWPRPVGRALGVELVLLLLVAAGWWATGGHPSGLVQPFLLGAAAVALGLQSSAILRFGVSGLSTTYMTGTLTTLVAALAYGRHPRNVLPSAQIIGGLVAGAAAAALLIAHAPLAVPLLQVLPVALALVAAPRHKRG
jgi:uncharacterized membrane protein YoaK (UPF0700 family)